MTANKITVVSLARSLRNAAAAHHKAMGDAEDDWAAWYAAYMAPRLNRAVMRKPPGFYNRRRYQAR